MEDSEMLSTPVVETEAELSSKAAMEEILRQMEELLLGQGEEENPEEPEAFFQSSLYLEGRPLLPPVVTKEKRVEMRMWREQALRVEQRVAKSRTVVPFTDTVDRDDRSYEEDFESDQESSEEEEPSSEEDEDVSIVVVSTRSAASPRSSGHLQSLIHRLRGDVAQDGSSPSSELALMRLGQQIQAESVQSINTVVENVDYQAPFRARSGSGSYTLEEPSPLLTAYMSKYSEGDKEHDMSMDGGTHDGRKLGQPAIIMGGEALPAPGEDLGGRSQEEHLNHYLGHLTDMPSVQPKKKSNVMKMDISEEEKENQTPDDINDDVSVADTTIASKILDDPTPTPRFVPSCMATLSIPTPFLPEAVDSMAEDGRFSIASSAMQSMSIQIQPTPREEEDDLEEATVTEEKKKKNPPEAMTVQDLESTTSRRNIGSSLAQEQQRRIQRLLQEQNRQREQKKLVAEIVTKVQPQPSPLMMETSTPQKTSQPKQKPMKAIRHPSTADLPSWAQRSQRPISPVVPAMASLMRPISTLPLDYSFPPSALSPTTHLKLCRLSALAKGFLTRRLLRTNKVQNIIANIRDTMNTALQLHQEARSKRKTVSKVDVALHGRLLQQLNRDYVALHDVFFSRSTAERMAIIALDHEMRRREEERKLAGGEEKRRRVSAVTKAKQEKRQMMEELAETRKKEGRSTPKKRRMKSLSRTYDQNSNRRSRSKENPKVRRHSQGNGAKKNLFSSTSASNQDNINNNNTSVRPASTISSSGGLSSRMSKSSGNLLNNNNSTAAPKQQQAQLVRSHSSKKPWK